MPAESYPAVIFVVAMFGAFMLILGWVSIWSSAPDRQRARAARAERRRQAGS